MFDQILEKKIFFKLLHYIKCEINIVTIMEYGSIFEKSDSELN